VDFVTVVDQAIALLRQRGRGTYRTLRLQLQLDDAHLEALKDGPTEGKLRWNPVGCWREVNMAVLPFRTGTCARK
jgi:hypothetical protein